MYWFNMNSFFAELEDHSRRNDLKREAPSDVFYENMVPNKSNVLIHILNLF